MRASPAISFVVPVFNGESLLDRCLTSIVSQEFDDFEIIIIDDGSTDNTAMVIARWGEKDKRIRIITQENQGQGASRNRGISAASGQWIWFVDSDDYLAPNVLPRIVALATMHDVDVLVTAFEFTFDNRPAEPCSPPWFAGTQLDPCRDEATFVGLACWTAQPWRLITRRKLLLENNIRFAEGVFYEDHPFAIKLMLIAKKVLADRSVSYCYYQRSTSTTNVKDSKAFDFIPIRRACIDLLREYNVYEKFPQAVIGYIAPFNFYERHVHPDDRCRFLEMLDADLTTEEEQFAKVRGTEETQGFLAQIRAKRPSGKTRKNPSLWGPSAASRDRRRKRLKRWRKSGRRFFSRVVGKLKSRDEITSGQFPLLTAEEGARIENATIDVRVNQENRPYVIVGRESHVSGHFVFERGKGQIVIGARSSIGGSSMIICSQEEGVKIGNNVMLSWDVTVTDTDAHSLNPAIRQNDAYDWKCGLDAGQIGVFKDWSQVKCRPVVINDGAWIGFGASILKGVTIGAGAVVGAKSVVSADVAPYNVVAGNPARFIRLVPRDKWSIEELVHALHGDPTMQDTLKALFLHRDFHTTLRLYRASAELEAVTLLMKEFSGEPRRLLEINGGNGVAAVAFALRGMDVTVVEKSSDPLTGTRAIPKMVDVGSLIDEGVTSRVHIVSSDFISSNLGGEFDCIIWRRRADCTADVWYTLQRIRANLEPGGVVLIFNQPELPDELRSKISQNGNAEAARANEREIDVSSAQRAGFELVRVIDRASFVSGEMVPREVDVDAARKGSARAECVVLKLAEAKV